MKKLHKLHVQNSPFLVIALVCPESHLKMSWLLNTKLGFEFKDSEGFSISEPDGSFTTFPVHKDETSHPEQAIALLKNRVEGKCLLKSLPNIDFFLKIEGNVNLTMQKDLVKRIKRVEEVLGVILIDIQKNKDTNLLGEV